MKLVWSKRVISPEVGTKVAGYGTDDVSSVKSDDLYLSLLCLDDGRKKVVMISYDLLGIDEKYIRRIRHECAGIFGGNEADVILSCSHTHTGPNTRTLAKCPSILEVEYLEQLVNWTVENIREVLRKDFIETDVYFYSSQADLNRNRRLTGPENTASFLPHCPEFTTLADGFADKELGLVFFFDKITGQPVYVIGNYAAHPLAGHCEGIGGHRISADFPGEFRNYIESETGAGCMFVSGAAGDMVPHEDETGREAVRKVGIGLAQAALSGMRGAKRSPGRFLLKNESLQTHIERLNIPLRKSRMGELPPDYAGKKSIDLEIQLLSIGDICFVGVPGELLAELGQEIKWHSPFRRTFIAYCSTAYFSYICHGNALVSGGYEGNAQWLTARGGLMLVNAAIEGAYKLRAITFPEEPEDYPDNLNLPLVAMKNILEQASSLSDMKK